MHQLHRVVGKTLVFAAELVHRHHARVFEARRDPGLGEEAFASSRPPGHVAAELLQRDQTPELLVHRSPDQTKSAAGVAGAQVELAVGRAAQKGPKRGLHDILRIDAPSQPRGHPAVGEPLE